MRTSSRPSSGKLTTASTNNITVVAQTTVASLYIRQEPPASVQAGAGFGLAVGGEDQFGNVTALTGQVAVAIAKNPGGAVLGGTTTVTASAGVATFSGLSLSAVGTGYTLTASAPSVTSATTSAITVTATTATKLVIPSTGEPPATDPAGQAFSLVVDAEDQYGNLDPTFQGTVTIAQPGSITGTTTVTASKGIATFSNLAIDTAGTYTLQATSGTLTPANSTSITITASTPAKLVWTTQPPGTVTQGIAFAAALAVQDQYGNPETTYDQNVTAGLDSSGNPDPNDLGGTDTVAASGGAVSFGSLVVNNSGSAFTLVATSNGITSPPSNAINVVLPHLVITTQPSSAVTAGAAFTIAVSVETNLNALDSAFSGNVALLIDSGPTGAAITGTSSATVSGGTATMGNVTLDVAGTYTLKVSGANLSPVDTVSISVAPQSTVAALVIEQQPPATVQAGTTFGLEVAGEDQFGNSTPLTGQVALALSNNPSSATLGGTTTVTASKGVAQFSGLTIDTVGTGYTIAATSPSVTSATTNAITVTNAAATQLVIPSTGEPPATEPAGQAFSLVVDAEDPYGNIDPNFAGTVTITQPSNLIGTTSLKAASGVATFSDLVIDTAGTYQLQVTSSPLSPATSTSMTVTGSSQSSLLVWAAQPPGQVVHNAGFGVTIDVKDQFGNLETGYSGSITVALDANPGGAVLHGTTNVNVSGGVARFSGLSINVIANNYTLVATSNSLSTPASSPIDVTPIPAASLKISTQPPTSVDDNQPFGLSVTALDSSGNADPDFQGNVSVSVQSPSDSNALGGTLTVAASDGVASFSNLTLNALGTYVLAASSNGLTPATTGSINVSADSAAKLVALTEPPGSFKAGAHSRSRSRPRTSTATWPRGSMAR